MPRYGAMAFVAVSLLATTAHANGFVPVLNFFHPDAWLFATLATALIVAVEGAILRWRIRQATLGGILWRALLLNGASSIAGSLILLALRRDAYFLWDMPSLLLPMFAITLMVEIPLLALLFTRYALGWKRAFLLGLGMNIASYALVIALQVGLFLGWLAFAGQRDERELAAWNRPDIVSEAGGLIYTAGIDGYGPVRLSVYDPVTREWTTHPNAPTITPFAWDVEGSLAAYVPWDEETFQSGGIVVARLPDFTPLLTIDSGLLRESGRGLSQSVEALAISPNGSKLAVLKRVASAVAPRNESSYFDLGGDCRLVVLDIASGEAIARASRPASNFGLCWHADSRRVLFTSYDNEALYDTREHDVRGNISYGIAHARDDRFRHGIYEFDLESETIRRFSDGREPVLALETGDILVSDGPVISVHDSSGSRRSEFEIPRLGYRRIAVSPCGGLILAEIRRHDPFQQLGRMVVLRMDEPEVRHMVRARTGYRLDWTGRPD